MRATPAPTFLLALLLPLLAAAPARADRAPGRLEQVTDLQGVPAEQSSKPAELTAAGGWLYFRAEDPAHGAELWRTDGSPGGAERVADLCPGACSSWPGNLVALGERLLFTAEEAPEEAALWAFGGPDAGPVRLAPVSNRHVRASVAEPGVAIFAGVRPESGDEPWVTDGTPEGTRLLADLCPGECSSAPHPGATVGGRILFVAYAGHGGELYHTDGTTAGTGLLIDLCPGACGSFPARMTPSGDRVFFAADDRAHGEELWVTDGTAAGTRLVMDLVPGAAGSKPWPMDSLDGQLYFRAYTGGAGNWRPWRTDGTARGTVLADELEPFGPGSRRVRDLTVAAGKLYFSVDFDLWVVERPGQPARALADVFRSPLNLSNTGNSVFTIALGDLMIFAATEVGLRRDPWVTDGTPEGTRSLAVAGEGSTGQFALFGGRVLFSAEHPGHGVELWTTDGTPEGTGLLEDVVPAASSSAPRYLVPFQGAVVFVAEDATGTGVWRHRPGAARAELLARTHWRSVPVTSAGNLFLLHGYDFRLAVYDPAAGGLVDLGVRYVESGPEALGDRVLFAQDNDLWTSDGTPGGTIRLHEWDWCPRSYGVIPMAFAAGGNRIFVRVETPDCGLELWASDGTAEETIRIEPPHPDFEPLYVAPLGEGRILATGAIKGSVAFWVVDVRDLSSTLFAVDVDGGPQGTVPAGGLVYFAERLSAGAFRLWRTDGTSGGTFPLSALKLSTPHSPVGVSVGSRLFFALADGEHGEELWVTDGTVAGTRQVRDLRPGPRGSLPRALTPAEEGIVFAADDGVTGHEPWWSDGTAEGTVRLADVAPGRDASSPGRFAAVGGVVYFDADDGESGRELWSVAWIEDPTPPADAAPIEAPELPGFRLWVRITAAGAVQPARREPVCILETVCVSGALPGRSELFVRIVGPKPNGRLWPTLVRFSTSLIDVWLEQTSSGEVRHYRMEAASPGGTSLDGLFDRDGFVP